MNYFLKTLGILSIATAPAISIINHETDSKDNNQIKNYEESSRQTTPTRAAFHIEQRVSSGLNGENTNRQTYTSKDLQGYANNLDDFFKLYEGFALEGEKVDAHLMDNDRSVRTDESLRYAVSPLKEGVKREIFFERTENGLAKQEVGAHVTMTLSSSLELIIYVDIWSLSYNTVSTPWLNYSLSKVAFYDKVPA